MIDVTGWGGKTKTYDVTIDQASCAYGLTLPQVLQALNNGNINVGGQTVNFGPQAAVVRGVGLIHSMDDIRDTMVARTTASPVLRRATSPTVTVGQSAAAGHRRPGRRRRHRAGHRADAARRARACRRSSASRQLIEQINTSGILPPGVRIERIYDRSDLINVTTHTVLHNMLVGIVADLRACNGCSWAICAAPSSSRRPSRSRWPSPSSLMLLRGESANLLSVGAIDFGLIVDATVIMVENIFRRLSQPPGQRFASLAGRATGRARRRTRAANSR